MTETLVEPIRAALAAVGTATLTTQLLRRGLRNTFLMGVRPLHGQRAPMIGLAWTLRYIPAREDLATLESLGSPEHPQRKAIETIPAGHVFIADCRADARAAGIGAILMARLAARGAAGFVCDGGVRDVASCLEQGLPIYAAGPSAPPNVTRHLAVEMNGPIGCGGVPVFPGDVIVGDADGVVAIPRHLAEEVARDAVEQERLEAFLLEEIRSGKPLFGTYPPSEATRERYRVRAGEAPGSSA